MQSIENAPADNRWIVITCLRAVNILIPFYFNLGENREKGLITDIFNYGSKYTIDQISGQLWQFDNWTSLNSCDFWLVEKRELYKK